MLTRVSCSQPAAGKVHTSLQKEEALDEFRVQTIVTERELRPFREDSDDSPVFLPDYETINYDIFE